MTSDATITPYLSVRNASKAIDFYKDAFAAVEQFRLRGGDGTVVHGEMMIGGAPLMLAEEFPDFGAPAPPSLGGSPVKLQLTVTDVDAAVERAVAAGATLVRPPQDQFHGHRQALLEDPFGYSWFVSMRVEAVPPEEMQRRFDAGEA